MIFASINIPIAGLTGVLIYVLQVTNQLKKYSLYTILDKAIVLVIILLALIARTDQFILIILADIFSKLIVLALMIYSCRDLIFGKGVALGTAIKELFDNINVGIKLMLANFAGMMVLGFGRFIIERFESVSIWYLCFDINNQFSIGVYNCSWPSNLSYLKQDRSRYQAL